MLSAKLYLQSFVNPGNTKRGQFDPSRFFQIFFRNPAEFFEKKDNPRGFNL